MMYSRSSNSYHIPRPPPATPEDALERPQTCMVVTTRETRIEEALHRAKTPVATRRRRVFPNDENGKDLYIMTREYPSKFTTDVMQEMHKENSAARKQTASESQVHEHATAEEQTTNLQKAVVKERVPTPWKPPAIETASSNSEEEEECTVVTNGSNLQREPSIVSTHRVVREYSFRRSSRGTTNEILVTSEQEFCVSQQPEYSNDDVKKGESAYNVAPANTEGHGVYMTSNMRRQSLDRVEGPTCCQGQNNNRFNINIKHKAEDPFQNGPGIVREKTIIATTITSPRTPLRRVKLDLESDSSNIALQYPIIGDDFPTFPRELILSDDEDYCSNVSADDEDTISEDDPEISSLTYPSSVGSAQECFDKRDRIRGLFSAPSRIFRNIKEFFTRSSKEERSSRFSMVDTGNQKAENSRMSEVQSAPPGLLREHTQMPTYVGQGTFSNAKSPPIEFFDSGRKQSFGAEAENIEEEIVGAMPREASQEDGILSIADTISQGGRSSVMSPSLESAPPSALKKRGSTSRSGSVKKQKVQFDMDVEVHLVPRDAYDTPDARRDASDPFESIYDGQQLEDDGSSQISNDRNGDEEDMHSRESNHISNAGKIRQHGPSVPFRVIKRETPTGGGRRGRRNSYDLIQKTIARQFRNQTVPDPDRMHHRRVYTTKAPLSPPRTPHTSYYHSRENRRSGEDPRLLARANAMSPDHFVAFYNKQQQLKQYLDHERRLRRQQLFNGNMKYQERQRKLERTNSKLNDGDDDSDTDSGASVGDRVPRMQSHVHDPPLPQPRPYIQREPAGGRRRFLTEEERSRVSSGYGGSASEVDASSLPSMMTQQSNKQPFTQRQVAEVMRAAGINKGRSPYLEDAGMYEEQRNTLSARYRQRRHDKAASDGGSTYTKLSQKAKQALQQAQMAYTSSLNEMMPVGKGYPGVAEPKEQLRLSSSQRGYPYDGYSAQHASRYLPGQSKGRISEGLIRNQSIVGTGYRGGSAHVSPSSGYMGSYPVPPEENRPGLSARLPLNARRLPHRQRSNGSYNASQAVIHQNNRSSGDPYMRLTSGNKSPYLKSQLPDEWTRKLRHSFSEQDSSKYRTFFNHAPSSQLSSKPRNSDSLKPRPPQLRRKRLSYTASDPGVEYSRRLAPRMMA